MTTITIPRAVVEQALEALELTSEKRDPMRVSAIAALRAALAQQAEPVQRSQDWHDGVLEGQLREREHWLAQPAPPQRKPLTEEEIDTLWRAPMSADWEHREFARAIERAHGIVTCGDTKE